jgi:hypothetical protein
MVMEQPSVVMAAAQMEPPVVLVVPPATEHVGEERSKEIVPMTRVAAVAQPVVTPPL